MNRFTVTAFDETVQGTGTTTALTSSRYDATLGMFDQLAVDVVVNDVAGALTSITARVDLEHSADGIHYDSKTFGLIPTTTVNLSGTTQLPTGFDDGTRPTLAFARLVLTLSPSPAVAFGADVVVTVTANDAHERDFARQMLAQTYKDCMNVGPTSWADWLPPEFSWLKGPPWNSAGATSFRIPCALFEEITGSDSFQKGAKKVSDDAASEAAAEAEAACQKAYDNYMRWWNGSSHPPHEISQPPCCPKGVHCNPKL